MGKKLWTIEKVKIKMAIIHPELELMQDFYVNTMTKMKLKCKVCGSLIEMSWNVLQSGSSCVVCYRNRRSKVYKVSLEDMVSEVEQLNPLITVLNEEYEGNVKSPIFCECKLDGYLWQTTLTNIRALKKCPKCSGCGKLTIEEIKERLELINPMIEILDDIYVNAKTKLKCNCKVHKKIFFTTWGSLRNGSGCPLCGLEKVSDKNRFTLEQVKENISKINPDVEIIDTVYVNSTTKLKCYCKIDKEIFYITYGQLQQGHGCRKCGIRKNANAGRLTLEYVKSSLADLNPDIEILDTVYIDSTTKMKCRCKIDNEIFYAARSTLNRNHGCPVCGIRKNSGENSWNWKGGISPLTMHLRGCFAQWKRDSMKACNYKCVVTGEPFKHIHHIHGFDLILQETLQIEDLDLKPTFRDYSDRELLRLEKTCLELHYKYGLGACVSESEHTLFHQTYGYGENNLEQWNEFLKSRVA